MSSYTAYITLLMLCTLQTITPSTSKKRYNQTRGSHSDSTCKVWFIITNNPTKKRIKVTTVDALNKIIEKLPQETSYSIDVKYLLT